MEHNMQKTKMQRNSIYYKIDKKHQIKIYN